MCLTHHACMLHYLDLVDTNVFCIHAQFHEEFPGITSYIELTLALRQQPPFETRPTAE